MSADNLNYVRFIESKWCVWLNLSASDDIKQQISKQADATFDTVREAVAWANEQGYTEYGTQVCEPEPAQIVQDAIGRSDIERLSRELSALLMASRPAVVPFQAMDAIRTSYLERGYKAALFARLPTYDDDLFALLIHETPNRILGVLRWSDRSGEWRMCEEHGPLLIMKAQLP